MTEGIHQYADGLGHADGVGQLHLALPGQPPHQRRTYPWTHHDGMCGKCLGLGTDTECRSLQRLAGCICDLSPGIPANHFRIVDVDTGKDSESQSREVLSDKESESTPSTKCFSRSGRTDTAETLSSGSRRSPGKDHAYYPELRKQTRLL